MGSSKDLHLQLSTSARLNSLDEQLYDVVLSDSRLKQCCFQIAGFVDAYLELTTAPPVKSDVLQSVVNL